jgi:hypothetical protein
MPTTAMDFEVERDDQTSWTLSHTLGTGDIITALYNRERVSVEHKAAIIDEETVRITLTNPEGTRRGDSYRLVIVG